MKAFLKKFRKTKLSVRLIYLFVLLVFIVSYALIFRSLVLLDNIETQLRIIALCVLGIILFIYAFFDLLALMTKKHKTVIITSFIVMIISALCIVGSLAINRVYDTLSKMNNKTILYTTNMILMKDTKFVNDSSFKVGIVDNETDVEGNILPYECIKKEKLKVSVEKYSSTFELLEKLYNGELNGIFITSNYSITYSGYEQYANIQDDVKVQFTYSKEMENKEYIESNASVEEPFTLLLMGVDSTSSVLNANAGFNGDTLMIITFNPKTLNATVFSIPRDTYVPIACINSSSKINSSAAYGTQCVIDTVQNLVDIKIDYYVKVNFKGVVDLVNALDGIDVTVPDGIKFCEQDSHRSMQPKDLQCIQSGFQHMNGEQALAFARHRHTLPAGDFQRVQHQQLVVEAIANSAKGLSSIDDFYKVLDAISANMNTNMSTSQILNLYNVGKNVITSSNKGSMINIQKTYLTGYDLTMFVKNLGSNVYTFQYYEQSLEEIKKALKETLEIEKPEIIKTFNFSINDKYEVPIIGKKYYAVKRNETIPNFVGQSLDYVKTWCNARSISVNVNGSSSGTVTYQSVRKGELTSGVSSITVTVEGNQQQEQPSNNVVPPVTTVQITQQSDTDNNSDPVA